MQRLRLIDILLDHCGSVNRQALIDYFGISEAQASRDIRDYLKLAQGNATYDTLTKSHVRGLRFIRVWK